MTDAVIVSTARTPIGRVYRGTLAGVDAFEMAQHVVTEAIGRSGLDPRKVDDIILAESAYGGGDIARNVAVEAGMDHVPGAAVNCHCAAGLTAVVAAASSIRSGMDRVVVAGGTHSMSTSPRTTRQLSGSDDWTDWMSPTDRATPSAPNMDCRSRSAGTALRRRASAARKWTPGRAAPSNALSPGSTAGRSTPRSRPSRSTVPKAPCCSPSTSTPDAQRCWRASPYCRRCTPRSRASASPQATRLGSTTPRPRW